MGMLHPMFNHLGRSKKNRPKPTKELEQARTKHEAFIRRLGARTGRKPLRGIVPLPHRVNDE